MKKQNEKENVLEVNNHDDENNITARTMTLDPSKTNPKYGEQAYWEERYKQLLENQNDPDTTNTGEQDCEPSNNTNNKRQKMDEQTINKNNNSPSPYHSWYFSYEELRPLILPIILGENRDESLVGDHDGHGEQGETGNLPVQEHEEEEMKDGGEKIVQNDKEFKDKKRHQDKTEDANKNFDNPNPPIAHGQEEEEEAEDDDEEETWQVIDQDAEEDEESIDRGDGLIANGPISILEIGCGDVPLGVGLACELQALQTAKASTSPIINGVKKILCVDYSPTVIEQMNKEHDHLIRRPPNSNNNNENKENDNNRTLPLEFAVVDARQLPMEKESIELILEKGTLDAMLSDPTNGIKHCQRTVRECARVLTHGGCLVIISHWNAHSERGMQWLHEIIFPGLQPSLPVGAGEAAAAAAAATSSTESNNKNDFLKQDNSKQNHCDHWVVEVHGKDEASTILENHDSKEQMNPIFNEVGPGPAVYVMHKLRPTSTLESSNIGSSMTMTMTTENVTNDGVGERPTIPVKFYTY